MINYVKKPPTLYELLSAQYSDTTDNINDLIDKGVSYIFDGLTYPKIDYRFDRYFRILFVSHFFTRRIGFETYLSFRIHLQAKLNIVIPKYSNLIKQLEKNDYMFGIIETTSRKNNDIRDIKSFSESLGESETNVKTDNIYSDTPQSRLDLVRNGDYATEYNNTENINKGTDKSNTSGNSNSVGSSNEEVKHESINLIEVYKLLNDNNFMMNNILKEFDCLFYQLV